MAKAKRPRDPNQLAKLITEISTGEREDTVSEEHKEKNPHAVALGRLGGLKGGKARANALSEAKRKAIAKKAAKARWDKKKKKD
jgi:hypothetical protein